MDGSAAGVDLSGGYYDSGDLVKFTYPTAFTLTILGWSIIEFWCALFHSTALPFCHYTALFQRGYYELRVIVMFTCPTACTCPVLGWNIFELW